jgi:oligoribonuclease NrnB/cAMP/cGMP phosphodiesterase (DHH superfamily)
VEKPNEAGILITIDPDSKAAGIVFGYLLDPFLDESDTFECLSRAHAYWLEGRYSDGMLRALAHLDVILQKRSRQARRDPDAFESKVSGATQKGDIVRRIRAGHGSVTRGQKLKEMVR